VILVIGKAMIDASGGTNVTVKIGSVIIVAGALLMLYIFATRRREAM
jgi:hypothetical protein